MPRLASPRLAGACSALLLLAASGLVACGKEGGGAPTGSGPEAPPAPPGPSAEAPPPTTLPAGSGAAPAASDAPKKEGAAGAVENVLVVSIDSVRADRMPWAKYEREVMPNLAKLAKSSVVYDRFYAISSYTAKSLGGFLGGKYPSSMKRSGYFFATYPEDEVMFPEILQKAGVTTTSAQAHFYFGKEKAGFHQGFDTWELIPGLKKSNTTDENITGPDHVKLALGQMEAASKKGKPFFAWYHLLDPHDQYMGHPEGKDFGKGATNLYDGELYFTDMQLGKILEYVDSQPWGKKTAIIVTSDHGDAFGEHKMYRHGFELWDILVHVPLVVHIPGAAPRVISEPRSGVDLAPTILELFGQQKDPGMVGESLVSEVRGGPTPARDVIVDLPRTSDNDRRRGLIRGKYKLLAFGDDNAFQLYDVVADPLEKDDLAKKEKSVFEEMKKAYLEDSKKIPEVCPKNTEKLKGKSKGKPC